METTNWSLRDDV